MKQTTVYTSATLQTIEERFGTQLRSVDELISFDRIILDTCINHIEGLNSRLKDGPFKITNPNFLAENTVRAIKNIRENDSLRFHYQSMFNSCLVLQVSYFTSVLEDIFKHTCQSLNAQGERMDLEKETLKQKNDINFQNMGSTIKTFKKYLNIEIEISQICNTIKLAQSCRHVIVHASGRADEKFILQSDAAHPRDIKQTFAFNDKIQFSQTELGFVRFAMEQFISDLIGKIKTQTDIY